MKKIKRFIVSFLTIGTLTLMPAVVYAQDVVEVPSDETSVQVPDTGIAPKASQTAKTTMVFVGASVLGALAAAAVIYRRQKIQAH